jgi:hypothetical protein
MGVGFIVKAKNFHRRARRERREINQKSNQFSQKTENERPEY